MKGPRSVILWPVLPNLVPWACCQALNFYKKFSVLQYPMSKVNGQSVAAQRRACGRDPPKEKKKKMFHVKHGPVACCLWTTLVGCGACLWAGPTLFLFLLEGWWNTTSPLFLFRNFLKFSNKRTTIRSNIYQRFFDFTFSQ